MDTAKFRIRPDERLFEDFPWQAFAGGWIAIAKAFAWLFSEVAVSGPPGRYILLHYALFSIAFLICGIGIWNLRQWAQRTAIAFAAANAALFLYFNYYALLALQQEGLLTKIFMLISGPVGDMALIFVLLYGAAVFSGPARKNG